MSDRYDVLVAGGGLVGGGMANLLAAIGLRVALVDAGTPPPMTSATPCGARVVALSRASERVLQDAGAWHLIAPSRRNAYQRMRVWDAKGSALDNDALVFDCADVAQPNLGSIVENDAIVRACHEAARPRANLTWLTDSPVTAMEFNADFVRVDLAGGARLRAALVIGADGARSVCRALAGIDVREGGYAQEAVVSHVRSSRPHDATAWQRFLPNGPLAFLPLADGRSSLVWSTTPEEARSLLALGDDAFAERLTAASDGVLGDITACSERLSFPLAWLHAVNYCRPRFVLIGDAAHAIHPLAGQGVNLGLLDAATLAGIVGERVAARRDIGDLAGLRRYERWRKSENGTMLAALTTLNGLFGSSAPLLAAARRAGLGYVNRIAPLKRNLILRAMGLAGDLPASVIGVP